MDPKQRMAELAAMFKNNQQQQLPQPDMGMRYRDAKPQNEAKQAQLDKLQAQLAMPSDPVAAAKMQQPFDAQMYAQEKLRFPNINGSLRGPASLPVPKDPSIVDVPDISIDDQLMKKGISRPPSGF